MAGNQVNRMNQNSAHEGQGTARDGGAGSSNILPPQYNIPEEILPPPAPLVGGYLNDFLWIFTGLILALGAVAGVMLDSDATGVWPVLLLIALLSVAGQSWWFLRVGRKRYLS